MCARMLVMHRMMATGNRRPWDACTDEEKLAAVVEVEVILNASRHYREPARIRAESW